MMGDSKMNSFERFRELIAIMKERGVRAAYEHDIRAVLEAPFPGASYAGSADETEVRVSTALLRRDVERKPPYSSKDTKGDRK